MAISNGYLTLAQAKAAIATEQPLPASVDRDAIIERAVEAASRGIDEFCGRFFYATGSATTKKFRATDPYELTVPDIHTTSGLIVKTDTTGDGTFDTAWTLDTDHHLEPLAPEPGRPWTRIVAIDTKTFPLHRRRATVQVDADWGWASVPTSVVQSCQILMAKYFYRKDSPHGVAGFGDFGAVRVISGDRDVSDLLRPFQRLT